MDTKLTEEKIGDFLINFITTRKNGVTFIDLEDFFEAMRLPYDGDYNISINHYDNLLMWSAWNDLAIRSFMHAMESGKIMICPCSPDFYREKGKYLDLPLTYKVEEYEDKHWMPVMIHPNTQKEEDQYVNSLMIYKKQRT